MILLCLLPGGKKVPFLSDIMILPACCIFILRSVFNTYLASDMKTADYSRCKSRGYRNRDLICAINAPLSFLHPHFNL